MEGIEHQSFIIWSGDPIFLAQITETIQNTNQSENNIISPHSDMFAVVSLTIYVYLIKTTPLRSSSFSVRTSPAA